VAYEIGKGKKGFLSENTDPGGGSATSTSKASYDALPGEKEVSFKSKVAISQGNDGLPALKKKRISSLLRSQAREGGGDVER